MMRRSHLFLVSSRIGGSNAEETMVTTLGHIALTYVGERLRRGEIERITARGIGGHLMSFAVSYGKRPLNQLSHKAVERWLEEMVKEGLAASTRAVRLSSLRTFARWCVITGVVDKDWTLLAPKVRRPEVVPHDMANEHVALVLAEARNERELLIGWLMFGCGLRCVEVSRLDVEDLDRYAGTIHVVGKRRKERVLPIPEPALRAWDNYLVTTGHSTGALVRYWDGTGRLGPERISGLVGHLCRASGVKIRKGDGRSAHGIRAAGASDLYEACLDPLVVQEFLGHASLAAGRPYLRRAEIGKVRDAQDHRPFGAVVDLVRAS